MADVEVELVGELPPVQREGGGGGVWIERLTPLRDDPMNWYKVAGPTKNPHAVIANVTSGAVKGVEDVDWFEFAGRTFPTGETETVEVKDEAGNVIDTKEAPVREGYVYARYMDEDRKVERDAELAEKRAKRAEREEEESYA